MRVSVCNVLRARKEEIEKEREIKRCIEKEEQPTTNQTDRQIDRYFGEHLQFESKKGGNKGSPYLGGGGGMNPHERKLIGTEKRNKKGRKRFHLFI